MEVICFSELHDVSIQKTILLLFSLFFSENILKIFLEINVSPFHRHSGKEKNLCPYQALNSDSLVIQPVAPSK
jgi:hypothetical protein